MTSSSNCSSLNSAFSISSSVLNTRLADMRDTQLVELLPNEGYALTKMGRELHTQLTPLGVWSEKWAKALK
jgi:DNA-binding HxlR family transcriptional regulator